ncbi:MAG: Fe-S cluster assembly ATPase SufC [Verrucomicrobia bacterium CG_4_10_14_3_um_filter_43_23]|nr:MAG: Fe-S cluster assembly ATPase SufC [Verrucomicrobia bacterium CG22_combo_CG10-13_8_21_14_all_43_17]PIX59049.1 MAG: Fe-S cluster assembly ATPase SufC [Verrucomicrobia bacterium CG_4_10_14_3_um_filter_43_23]PIY62538.1 MAG: Fe-S cluster assembly ATPase SufC [Verrucomicrobia bacterium CG_4_10_14_0_8_um_filter_43_34]PJA44642.1 MAG: Fe-S cluster assembly ATPase SufC [Verrucomicrobia bacterium CG_4_9_14_3_um_filter_43_20]
MDQLEIKNLNVFIENQHILKDFTLNVPKGQVHAIMGPNGTGKSTLAKALVGHPEYEIDSGEITLDGQNVVGMAPDEISRMGLFMAFQYPNSIPGVTLANFIRAAVQARMKEKETFVATDYYKRLYEKMDLLGIDRSFTSRAINDGFSGGEKKRCEILQMMMLSPKYAVLDETDSGLDIDALKVVAEGVEKMRGPETGFLIITHYQRLLNYIVPDVVHVMYNGQIVRSGGKELALELEAKGYDWVKQELANSN